MISKTNYVESSIKEQNNKIILTINSFGRGGAEMSMALLAEKLAKSGDSVIYLSFWNEPEIYDFKWLVDSGVTVITLSEKKQGFIKDIINFIIVCKKEKPKYIYSAMLYANLLSQISAWLLNIRHIASVRNDPAKFYNEKTIKKIVFCLVMAIQREIVFISRKAYQNYAKTSWGLIIRRKKVSILHNPIDIKESISNEDLQRKINNSIRKIKNIFENKENNSNEIEELNIVIVSRLVPGKGIIELLDQIKDDFNKYKKINLRIYGEGALESEIYTFIERYMLNRNVELMGYCDDISSVYNSADMLIFPSLNEGFGRVPFEAFMRGNLILCNEDVSIINEFICSSNAWRTYKNNKLNLIRELEIFSETNTSICSDDIYKVRQLLSIKSHLENFKKIQLKI